MGENAGARFPFDPESRTSCLLWGAGRLCCRGERVGHKSEPGCPWEGGTWAELLPSWKAAFPFTQKGSQIHHCLLACSPADDGEKAEGRENTRKPSSAEFTEFRQHPQQPARAWGFPFPFQSQLLALLIPAEAPAPWGTLAVLHSGTAGQRTWHWGDAACPPVAPQNLWHAKQAARAPGGVRPAGSFALRSPSALPGARKGAGKVKQEEREGKGARCRKGDHFRLGTCS